jgi:hypothetical protein
MSVTIRGTDNSSSTPAVTGTDGDTGLFFPATNQLALATNGSERVRVDSGGNVLIGTTAVSPASANSIYVYPSDSTVRFTNTTANGKEWTIGTSSPGVAAADNYFAVTNYSGSAWSQYMKIDGSGRVTMPSQTAFYVYANGADTYSGGAGWSKARMATYGTPNEFNTSLFNFSTNMFTAPVAGRYLFSTAITMTGSSNTDGTIGFALNGAGNPAGGRSMSYSSGTGLGGMDCVNVLNLAAGDTVAVYFYQSGNQTTRNTQYAGYFCGYLLG